MKFIVTVENKVVFAIDPKRKDLKEGYKYAQEHINKLLNDLHVDKYKLIVEH